MATPPRSPQARPPARTPLLPWLCGLALALALAAGAGFAAKNPALLAAPGRARLLNGAWSGAYERRFEQALPFRPAAVSFWALLRWVLFAEGNRGLLAGREGWLFTAEEFQSARSLEPAMRIDLAAIREVQGELTARGVGLVIALVPAKARVYPEHLGRYSLPAELAGRYRAQREALAALGLPVPDLLEALRQAKREGEVFLRTDTHWAPLGAAAAAHALAAPVEDLLQKAGSPRAEFASADAPPVEYRGDLLNFLPLGRFTSRWGPKPDTLTPRRTSPSEAAGGGLFDALAIPVVLVGTSYSAGELWNLDGALKTAVRADVLNVAKQGQGALVPMRALLDSPTLEEVQADVVVWEIPERYFVLP